MRLSTSHSGEHFSVRDRRLRGAQYRLAAAGTALVASGMFAVTAVSFAPPAGAAANNPVSATLGFNIFVEGNAELNQNESEGAVAIGGDLKMNNGYQVAFVAGAGVTVAGTGGGSNVGLVVGGKVDFAHSTGHVYVQNSTNVILGDASNGTFTYLGAGQSNDFRSGGSPGTDPLLRTGGNLTTGTPINFSTQFATLRQYSANMAALNPTDCPTSANIQLLNDAGNAPWSSGNATVKLTANKTNVFNTNLTALSAIPGWGHDDPSQTQPLVINISDAGVINLAARDLGAIQNGASYVLWNFPNATAVNITSGHFWGSLFAPNADVSGTGGAFFEGNVVAKTFVSATGAGETHRNHMADFTVDCLDTATTTTTGATTTTTGATTTTTGATTTTTGATTTTPPVSSSSTASTTASTTSPSSSTTARCSGANQRTVVKVFDDKNNNGKQDSDENGIPGVTIQITVNGVTKTSVTDSNGVAVFDCLAPGDYTTKVLGVQYDNQKALVGQVGTVSVGANAPDSSLGVKGVAAAKNVLAVTGAESRSYGLLAIVLMFGGLLCLTASMAIRRRSAVLRGRS